MAVTIDFKAKTKPKSGSTLRMAKKGSTAEIYLYGVVGDSFFSDGITAKQFADDLAALGDVSAIDLRINSEGGDVFQGRAIYNLLVQHKADVTVYIDGWAASIASLIAMAGDKIRMGDGTYFMIHNPWGWSVGEATEMRRVADLLDSIAGTMIESYAKRSGQSRDKIKQWMDVETTWTAQEAVDLGFADEIIQAERVAALVVVADRFKNLPAALRPNRAKALSLIRRETPAPK